MRACVRARAIQAGYLVSSRNGVMVHLALRLAETPLDAALTWWVFNVNHNVNSNAFLIISAEKHTQEEDNQTYCSTRLQPASDVPSTPAT